jgi:hypothetical protein
MRNRFGRASVVIAATAALSVMGGAAAMAQSASKSESSLLGVTLLKSSYRDVLKRFGRPDEIQAGGPFVPSEGAPSNRAASGQSGARGGGMMGPMGGGPMGGSMGGSMGPMGVPGMSGMSGGGGGKKATSKTGFPGRSGTGPSGPTGGPGMGMSSGAPGMMGGGGLPGFGGGLPGMGGTSGYPGMGGSSGFPGLSGEGPGAGAPGMSGSAAGAAGASAVGEEAPEYEATWWYHDKTNGLHKSFLFNKDGRVIQIQEYGYDKNHKGSKTRLGVGLGSSFNTVLRNYGWSNDGANDGQNMIMRFGGEDKVAFQLVKNVVVGITVAIVKDAHAVESP